MKFYTIKLPKFLAKLLRIFSGKSEEKSKQ
ncbi:stage V sporulation protein SpoVM [Natranaerobius trueperi]|uniref:Stage V sporulation protein M n=1 Tax=Natranaerobius trueperi TaxID=759412 RepID=A0A226BYS4_9FIRM|nr:stage V sporulation protein SpoVM [Natranaerobius trueperi]OWZ84173.1 hypothetical protein CDO51_04700 [Natranaerobius trueperi]